MRVLVVHNRYLQGKSILQSKERRRDRPKEKGN